MVRGEISLLTDGAQFRNGTLRSQKSAAALNFFDIFLRVFQSRSGIFFTIAFDRLDLFSAFEKVNHPGRDVLVRVILDPGLLHEKVKLSFNSRNRGSLFS